MEFAMRSVSSMQKQSQNDLVQNNIWIVGKMEKEMCLIV